MMRRVTRVVVVLSAVIIEAFIIIEVVHTLGSSAPQLKSVALSPPSLAPSGSNPDFTGVVAPLPEDADGSLRVQGNADAVQVEIHQASITKVLSVFASTFNFRYRSSIALDGLLNNTYAGSLRQVLSSMLNGYNYTIKYENSQLDLVIFGRRGEQAVVAPPPSPTPAPSPSPTRRANCTCPTSTAPLFVTRQFRPNGCACEQ